MHFPPFAILLQQAADLRELVPAEILDPLAELGIELLLHPGQVLPLCTDAGTRPLQADPGGVVQQKDGIRCPQPELQGAQVVAVDDPRIAPEQPGQLGINSARLTVVRSGRCQI